MSSSTGPRRCARSWQGEKFRSWWRPSRRASDHEPNPDALAVLAGRYRSDEIGTVWTLSFSGGALVVDGPVFDEPAVLERVIEDEYAITKIGATVRFTLDRRRRVTGFEFGLDSMCGVRFDRVP
jgi:hypothetical protein